VRVSTQPQSRSLRSSTPSYGRQAHALGTPSLTTLRRQAAALPLYAPPPSPTSSLRGPPSRVRQAASGERPGDSAAVAHVKLPPVFTGTLRNTMRAKPVFTGHFQRRGAARRRRRSSQVRARGRVWARVRADRQKERARERARVSEREVGREREAQKGSGRERVEGRDVLRVRSAGGTDRVVAGQRVRHMPDCPGADASRRRP